VSVHQLKDGRWIVAYRSGKKYLREYFGRGLEVEKNARERNEQLNLNEYHRSSEPPKPLSPTFFDLTDAYFTARSIHMQESTLSALKYKLEAVILPAIGRFEAVNITHKQIDKYVQARLSAGKSKSTIHRELSDIMAILNWSVKRGLLLRNPLSGYQKPKRDDEIIIPPSHEEANKIMVHAADHLVRALSICYYTGLRPGASELLKIKWSDIEWSNRTILIRSAKKGGIRSRVVPLHDSFLDQLRKWHVLDGHDNEIIQYSGQPVASLKKSFASTKRRAGITRRLPLYSFRHAFASIVLANSADLKATSEILGHSRPDTTLRIYQHTNVEMHRAVVDLLPGLDHGKSDDLPNDKSNDLPKNDI
jgi:integrase